jgi:hypothetical protein
MPAEGQGVSGGPLTRDEVLDELDFLASVEHALVVEYLSVCCALGHDLQQQDGGATTRQGRAVAGAAAALAIGEMFHLKGVNRGLVGAGRSPQLGRAASIASDSVAEIALGPPSRAELVRLLDRLGAIASAVDERYARLRPAVTSDALFDGDLLGQLRSVIAEDGPTHVKTFATLRDSVGDLRPEERFAQQDMFVAGSFRGLAVSAMEGLDEINRALVQRGLLPPFTLA